MDGKRKTSINRSRTSTYRSLGFLQSLCILVYHCVVSPCGRKHSESTLWWRGASSPPPVPSGRVRRHAPKQVWLSPTPHISYIEEFLLKCMLLKIFHVQLLQIHEKSRILPFKCAAQWTPGNDSLSS